MKKISILILGALSLLASCNKNSSPNTTPASGLVIQSVAVYPSSQGRSVLNLRYNAAKQLSYLSYYFYDTAGSISEIDTGSYNFTIDGATNLPTSYIFTNYKTAFGGGTQTDNLFFDASGRMIKDTVVVGQGNPGDSAANYFSYSTNRIIIRDYNLDAYDSVTTGNGWGAFEIDTLVLVNSNVTSRHAYSQNGAAWILDNSTDFPGFSTYANPYYNALVSNTFGAFFLDLGYVDFLSKQLPSTGVAHWTTDASGRVIAGLGMDGSSVTFTYQ